MPFTLTYNMLVSARSTMRETASEALETALELQAKGHATIKVADPSGAALSLGELEDLVRRGG